MDIFKNVLIGLITGLISGVVSGWIVNKCFERKQKKIALLNFWENFLFNTLGECEMYIPNEILKSISDIGETGSDWNKAILEIISLTNPYTDEDIEFNDRQAKIAENVNIALKELQLWKNNNKIK